MPFNPSPQSWLTNYTFSSDTISFDLASNYTSSMADPVKFMFRITDDILAKYSAKASADRPYHWESSATYIQPVLTSPNTLKNVTNAFVLDATLFSDLLTPSIPVTVVAQDLVYNGYPYTAFSYTAPSGSAITVEYSSDGGLTWLPNAPTARGSYYIRVTAAKDGRTGSATDSFAITKNTPGVVAPSDVSQVYSAGTTTLTFTAPAGVQFISISSSNPAAVSVVSFTQSGSVTLQRNASGEAVITGSTGETGDYFATEASFTFTLTKIPATITAPATLALNASAGLSQTFAFTTNFTMTTARWNLITFESSDTSIATITKGGSYPATINILQAGSFTLTIAFPGDSEYGDTSGGINVSITGIQPSMMPTITFPGQSAILTGEPFNTNWVSGKQAQILAGLDTDSDGEGDAEITLPFSFTININQPTSGTGSSGALTYSFNTFFPGNTSWITFTQGANSVGVTINSFPGTTNGEVNGGQLTISKEPSSGVLGWTGTFDINFYRAGARLVLMQSGFYGTAGSTFTEVTQSTVVLNAAGEYGSDWSISDNCCPHVAYIKLQSVDGAPTGNISLSLTEPSYHNPDPPISFPNTSYTQTVAQNAEVLLHIHNGGTTMLTASIPGTTPTLTKTLSFDVKKISSSMTTNLDSIGTAYSICCESNPANCQYLTIYTMTSENYDPSIVISTSPENIAWDGLTTSRISISFSEGSASNPTKTQLNNGKTKARIRPQYEGITTMTASLSATSKYGASSITRSINSQRPLLTAQKTYSQSVHNWNQTCFRDGTPYFSSTQAYATGYNVQFWARACSSSNPPMAIDSEEPRIPIIVRISGTSPTFSIYPPAGVNDWNCGSNPSGAFCGNGNNNQADSVSGSVGRLFLSRTSGFSAIPTTAISLYRQTAFQNGYNQYQDIPDYQQNLVKSFNSVPVATANCNYSYLLITSTFYYWTNHPATMQWVETNWPQPKGGGSGNWTQSEWDFMAYDNIIHPYNSLPAPQTSGGYSASTIPWLSRIYTGSPNYYPNSGSFFTGGLGNDLSSYTMDFQVLTSPEFPYKNGYLGDYFNFPGSPTTLTYGTQFTGEAGLGSEFFSLDQEVPVYNILV